MTIKKCLNCGKSTERIQPYCSECEYMTQKDAYKRLKCSRSTYLRIVASGKLHPRRIGVSKLLVLRAEVDAILG